MNILCLGSRSGWDRYVILLSDVDVTRYSTQSMLVHTASRTNRHFVSFYLWWKIHKLNVIMKDINIVQNTLFSDMFLDSVQIVDVSGSAR